LGRNREKLVGISLKIVTHSGGVIALVALVWVYFKAVSFRNANSLAAPLSRSILRRLAAHRREFPDNPYLSVTHLRDELLESLPANERSAVWNRVKKLVEGNSNVRAGGAEVRGDFHRTWEWVGDLGAFRGEEILSPSSSYARMEQIRGDQDWTPTFNRSVA
jgi:Man1-Src1p-C-terminal domain